MKFLLTILLSAFTLLGYSQWNWVNPKPLGYGLNDIHFITEDIGYIVGNKGTVLKTIDNGESWELIPQTIFNNFLFGWFCTVNTGYVVSDSGTMFKTVDGGLSWTDHGTGINEAITDIYFQNEQTGFIITEAGSLYKTADGGNNWQLKISSAFPLTSVTFVNENEGIATGKGGRYFRTTNGGNTWVGHYEMENLWSVAYSDENHCFISGQSGFFMRSSDGGNTWQTFNCGASLDHLFFINNLTGYALSSNEFLFPESNSLYKTTDGGNNWTLLNFDNLSAFHVRGDGSLVAVGWEGRLLTTEDDCDSYINFNPSLTYEDLILTKFPSADTGYAVSYLRTALKTIDGGENWEVLPLPGPIMRCYGMWFTDNETGYITCDTSILKTTDGGMTWNIIFSSFDWLSDIFFVDNEIGYVIGEGYGLLYKTEDGGATWSIILQGYYNMRAIQFINRDTGYIVLSNSILKTTDGGVNWNETMVDESALLLNLYFVNSQVGYLCGSTYTLNRPTVYKTTDGGQSWSQQIIYDSYATGLSIYFIDENKGFMGSSGNFYQTGNGGETWINLEYMAGNFNSICFSSPGTGFVTGSSGAIMKTTNAGLVPVISIGKPDSQFSLYPNPATDEITLESNNAISPVNVSIYNSNGLFVYDQVFSDSNIKVETAALPGGIYFIKIKTPKNTEVKKLVVL